MKKILKRDGRQVNFDARKIESAILKAFVAVDGEISEYAEEKAKNIAQYKATGGLSGWDASYTILKSLSETSEK